MEQKFNNNHLNLKTLRDILSQLSMLLATLLLLGTLSSCRGGYPKELVQADSLLLRGDYHAADSLLAIYDANASSRKSAQMYRHLLQMGRLFVDGNVTDANFSMVDSLCRYYDHWYTQDEYAQSLCFLGKIYKVSGDNPSALDALLKGVKVAEDCGNSYVQGWLCQQIGDVYFDQRMLDDCTNYYRKYYDIAVSHRDTLRMALAAFRMGRVYTINNMVDSTIYYYNKSIELGNLIANPEVIVPHAMNALTDIYIQVEEFDKAQSLMPRDSMNDANWAYWHLGQHHIDSALWYLEKIRGRYEAYGERETCLNIARLEASKGNVSKALSYYQVLPAIEDSINMLSQVEETKRVNAQFNFNLIKKERDIMAQRNTVLLSVILIVTMVLILGVTIGCLVWKNYRQKKDAELAHERLLRQEEERKSRQSAEQIAKNQQQMILLRQQLQEAQSSQDAVKTEKLEVEARLLDAENGQIQARLQHQQMMQDELERSPLRERIKQNAGKENFHLTNEEWLQLAMLIDAADDQFTNRLRNLYGGITEYELHICYLVKLDIPSVAIGVMLYKSKAAIGMARQRLYKKLTGKSGTAKQFNDFIQAF